MGLFAGDMVQRIKTGNSDQQNGARNEESFERVMFDDFPGLIILVDVKSHTIADLNEAAAKAMGVHKSEIAGQSCHNFIRPAPGRIPPRKASRITNYPLRPEGRKRHRTGLIGSCVQESIKSV